MIGEDIVKTLVAELERLVSTEKIVGKAQTFGDVTVIPVCSIGFGFGAGGGAGSGCEGKAGKGSGEGGGGGAGGGVSPVALIVIRKDVVEVLPLKSKGSIASVIESMGETIPKVMDKAVEIAKVKGEKKGK